MCFFDILGRTLPVCSNKHDSKTKSIRTRFEFYRIHLKEDQKSDLLQFCDRDDLCEKYDCVGIYGIFTKAQLCKKSDGKILEKYKLIKLGD